jgi:hypothetical protein
MRAGTAERDPVLIRERFMHGLVMRRKMMLTRREVNVK